MVKKVIKIFLIGLFLIFMAKPIMAKEDHVIVHFFWAHGCPHCAKEEVFLESLTQKYPELEIKSYEVTKNRESSELLQNLGKELSADVRGVPFIVIGKDYIPGFFSDETTGVKIEQLIVHAIENGYDDLASELNHKDNTETTKLENLPNSIKLPILGEVEIKNLSLPALTFLIAFLDGFNPCAMWTLLFLISLLLGMKDKKRMWLLGVTFIASSAFVYFLFLSAWLNLFLFLGFIIWVRIIIGITALSSGGYYLRDYFTNKDASCNVMGNEKRQKFFEKLKKITQKKQLLLALGGIILLAFAVNLVELICSAGLPAIYTQILSLSDLPKWQYYFYLVFYVLIFMLDDLFIFFVAMRTLQATGIQNKYARYSHLVGGILMIIIGILMLFKPELLMFG